MENIDYWEQEDVFPFLVRKAEDKTHEHFEIRLVKAPEPPVAAPRAEELDESLISGILPEYLPKRELSKPIIFLQGPRSGSRTNARLVCALRW